MFINKYTNVVFPFLKNKSQYIYLLMIQEMKIKCNGLCAPNNLKSFDFYKDFLENKSSMSLYKGYNESSL